MAAEARGLTPFKSVRARTAAVAALVVGAAVAGAALGLVTLMQRRLLDDVRNDARLRARIVASTLEAGTKPASLQLGFENDAFVQVVDGSQRVVASSPSLHGRGPVAGEVGPQGTTLSDFLGEKGDDFLVVEVTAEAAGGPLRVLVGRGLDAVTESTSVVARLLLMATPLVIAVTGITAWLLVGLALAPVESIRREVADISATGLHRRVPIPASGDEIERLAATMNQMIARLEQSHRQREAFVADASHELRNPIAAIRHHVEVALAHPDSTTIEGLAGDVLEESLRLQGTAEDLLLLARADEDGLIAGSRPVELDEIVLAEATRLGRTTSLRIDTSAVTRGPVVGDRPQLERLVRNLADNAVRHARSVVRFSVTEEDAVVALQVDDDGDGIPEADRTRIFDRFARVDGARDRGHGGAGLGLAIVAAIAGAHGGSAEALAAPLGGARLRVALPRRTG